MIQSYEERVRQVKKFCELLGVKVQIVSLSDPFGPAITEPHLEAIVVTVDSFENAQKSTKISFSQ